MNSVQKSAGNLVDVGSMLRKARLAKNISIQDAADALHLRPSIVTALEENDFSEISGQIFLKGYVKSYARLVSLPEDQVLTQLDHMMLDQEMAKADAAPASKEQSGKGTGKAIALVVAVLGIGMLIGWQLGGHHWLLAQINNWSVTESQRPATVDAAPPEETVQTDSGDTTQAEVNAALDLRSVAGSFENEVVEEVVPESNSAMNESLEISGAVTSTVDSVAAELTPEPIAEVTEDMSEPVAQLTDEGDEQAPNEAQVLSQESPVSSALNPVQAVMVEPAVSIDPLPEDEAEGVSASVDVSAVMSSSSPEGGGEGPADSVGDYGSVEAEFNGDCWVQLKNGNGRTVIASLKRAGDKISYSGVTPFVLVLGDATVASVTFNQLTVDLSSHKTWKKRAEITLGQQ